jgi:hypothetical protein
MESFVVSHVKPGTAEILTVQRFTSRTWATARITM